MHHKFIRENSTSSNAYKLSLDQVLFLMGIFIKQFYLLPSGSLQIGDILMLGSFAFYFLIKKKGHFYISRDEYFLLAYFCCIAIINGIYFMVYSNVGFTKSTIYYVFNILILLVFVAYLQESNLSLFLHSLRKVLQFSLILQALLLVLGLGKWYSGSRYEGTFNDPNQYGVFIFFSVLFVYILGCMLNKKSNLWIILGFLLILPSSSAGMLVGYFAFIIPFVFTQYYKISTKKAILGTVVLIALALIIIGLAIGIIKVPNFVQELSMYKRFFGKLDSFADNSSNSSIASDREWDRLLHYPKYLLFGAGEGGYYRFAEGVATT
jgi:hypothetical protein